MPILPLKRFKIFSLFHYRTAFTYVFISSLFILFGKVYADTANVVSISFDISAAFVETGDIVTYKEGFYLKSFLEYDEGTFGVVNDTPILALEDTSLQNSHFITTTGEALVKVSAMNGPIFQGDYVTTSRVTGVGMKATRSGYVLGTAVEEFNPEDTTQTGQIIVYVQPSYAILQDLTEQKNILAAVKSGIVLPFVTPLTSFRYILAFTVVLISFFLGFVSFSKISTNSIQALGRNPLAGNLIKTSVMLNFVLTTVIIAVGLFMAYLILTL